MAKFCQTSLNSWLISRYYPRLTAIYLIFITIFEMRTRPRTTFIYCAPQLMVYVNT